MTRKVNALGALSLAFVLLMAFFAVGTAQAQNSYVLTSHMGSDSSESFFPEGSMLYMYVTTTNLDVQHMKKAMWTIKRSHSEMGGGMGMMDDFEVSGTFDNNHDSTFSASYDLSQLPEGGKWEWKARLEDMSGHEVEMETYFYYMNYESDSGKQYIELEGYVEAIGPDSIVVNGYVFYVDSNTVFEKMMDMSSLKVGDFVEVKALDMGDGTYLAIRIELKGDEHHHSDRYVKTKGVIEDVTDSTVTVRGQVFYVDAQTKIEGHEHTAYTLADLTVGMFVEIKAQIQTDGSYLAVKIEVAERKEEAFEFEFKGLVDSVGADYLVIAGQKIMVNTQTRFEFGDDQTGTLVDIQVGMKVEVKAIRLSDGTLVALKIEVKSGSNSMEKVEIKGAIDSIGVNFIVVLNYTIYVDSSTTILDGHYLPITLIDLKKGQIVKVKGYVQADGSILATKIKVKELWMGHFEIEGAIEAVGVDNFTVQGITFTVDSNTTFYNYDHTMIQFSDLNVGQKVEVKAVKEADGTYRAIRVKVKNPNATHIEVVGPIENITTDSIKVNGTLFFVDSTTVIYDLQDNRVTMAELAVAQIVNVRAIMLNDGTFWAVRIEIEDDPNVVTVSSALSGRSNSTVIVANESYKLSPSTVVVDSNFNVIDLSSITLGQEVTVWAEPTSDGSYQALQIQTNSTSAVTALNDLPNKTIVSSFVLKQNYPNPFNPTTTIEFVLNKSGFAKVKLEVYNMLGQRVKTLYNGVLDAGTYKFQWDGTNQAAQRVASGMYIYRLEVDQKAMVKQMVLIK